MNVITVYTSPTCPDCHALKDYLKSKGIEFTEKDITNEAYKDELEKKYGRLATPTVVINNRVFVGFKENIRDIEDALKGEDL